MNLKDIKNNLNYILSILIFGFGVNIPITIFAQEKVDWNLVKRGEESFLSELYQKQSVNVTWVGGSHWLFYQQSTPKGVQVILQNAENRVKKSLFKDVDAFVQQYKKLLGDSSITRDNLRLYSLQMHNNNPNVVYWIKSGKTFAFDLLSQKLSFAKKEVKHSYLEKSQKEITRTTHTADSAFTMLGDQYNLYLKDNHSGQQVQLTTDGKESASYCVRSAKNVIKEGNAAGMWWNHIYIYCMIDDSEVSDLYLINALSKPRPSLKTKKMPLPNEKGVRKYKVFWCNADTKKWGVLPINKFKDAVLDINYQIQDNGILFTRRSRGVDTLELCRLDLPTGKTQMLIQEVMKPHLNITLSGYKVIQKTGDIIWWSERSGRGNYYLYNKNGQLKNRITQGETLIAGSILDINTSNNTIIFAGYGKEKGFDPCYTYYYKANLNGKQQELLTHGNGTHELSFSEDKLFAIDSYSRIDLPTVYNVVSIVQPKKNFEVVRRSDEALKAIGWQPPKLISLKAADEKTMLYGLMYLPYNLDVNKKYPIISNVYPGPQDDQLPRSFTLDDNGNQSLANMGFIVVNIPPRGSSPLRGKDFYTYGYGNLRDYPLADDKHSLEQLATKFSFIDLSRVGIYGHSGGAFMTVAAMLTYPSFYKVGVAASGNHDNNIYIQWWGETFHGLNGKIPTNIELAKNLQGRLLLMHGDMDDNVPYASTLRLVNAFIEEGKRFDMLILPGKDHSVWSNYFQNKVRYYFKEYLISPQKEDINIINHQ
ncbi:MAG: prolyl oligopeptidase family serine peptidase [Prevotella sp.]